MGPRIEDRDAAIRVLDRLTFWLVTAIVMGEAAIPWLERHRLAARLVGLDRAVHRVAGWPARQNRS